MGGLRTPLIAMLYVHPSRRDDLESPEEIKVEPNLPVYTYLDAFGNICGRLLAPPGAVRFSLDTRIRDSGEPDPEAPEAIQHNVEDLPDETLRFLLPSRYCEADKLNDEALKIIARCILFLHSNKEYEWPYFDTNNPLLKFSLKDFVITILTLGQHYRNKRKEQKLSYSEWQKSGDYDAWPFFRRVDYENQLKKHSGAG